MNFVFLQQQFNYVMIYNSQNDFLQALFYFVVTFAILYIIKNFTLSRIEKFFDRIGARDTEEKIDKIFRQFGKGFYLTLPFYIALKDLMLPPATENFLDILFLAVILYYGVKVINTIIEIFLQRVVIDEENKDKDFDPSFLYFIGLILKIGVWVVAILLFVSNLGYDITAVIAGLGIGGLAIAFALQNVFADIFASVSIYVDKPFKKGDFIMVGEDLGTVKHIGIKSTRIDSLSGEELVISNKELTDARIHNYKRMKERRIVFVFGLVYDTSLAKTKKAVEIVEKVISEIADDVEFDRVHFKKFGDFSLNYEVVYYVKTNKYDRYMDVQQEINFKIKEAFQKAKIEMAFPTQTLHIKK